MDKFKDAQDQEVLYEKVADTHQHILTDSTLTERQVGGAAGWVGEV